MNLKKQYCIHNGTEFLVQPMRNLKTFKRYLHSIDGIHHPLHPSMTDAELKQLVRVEVDMIMDIVVETIGIDGHTWSSRPCQTCLAITGLIGRPYGCYWYQAKKAKSKSEIKT